MIRSILVTSFDPFLLPFIPCFTAPTAETFVALTAAWILATGPRTVTGLIRTLGPDSRKSHDAYQNFFSRAAWSPEAVWGKLFQLILELGLIPPGSVIELSGDDTLLHHSGRKIFGVGMFRDAVRSSKKHVAYACGHNWVILCWIVAVPFCSGLYLAIPINARLRPKEQGRSKSERIKKAKTGPTTVELLNEMVAEVVCWAPDRRFRLLADGAYASLAKELPSSVKLVSRLRKDAALYEPPPPRRRGQVGRPPTKGKRLPTPQRRAKAPRLSWKRVTVSLYGEPRDLRLHSYQALWYEGCPQQLILIVIVRDPSGQRDDEFFFTTDLERTPEEVVEAYGRRWTQEVVHRELKQQMGIEDPQARVEPAVRRQAPFGMLMLALVKLWYLLVGHKEDSLVSKRDAWYLHKEGVSYADMLGALRYGSWRRRISGRSARGPVRREILLALLRTLAKAS